MEFLPESGQYARRAAETMPRRLHRNHTPAFKATVALAAVKGEKRLVNLAKETRRNNWDILMSYFQYGF